MSCHGMVAALLTKPLYQPVHLEVNPGCVSASAETGPERAMVSAPWSMLEEGEISPESLMEVRLSRLFPGWEMAKMPSRDC